MKLWYGCGLVALTLLGACASKPPAPVIERAPAPVQQSAPANSPSPEVTPAPPAPEPKPSPAANDWRPESYVVKKGDTLHAIGLEYGFDYKDIAAWNNIPPPYVIRIGQKLRLKESRSGKAAASAQKPAEAEVTVTRLKSEAPANLKPIGETATVASSKPAEPKPASASAQPNEPPLLSEPKVTKERYSDKAYVATPAPAKAAETSPAEKK